MNRSELIIKLADFTSPLSPFSSPEERQDQWHRWLLGLDEDTVFLFLELLTHHPDPEEYAPMAWEEFEFQIVEALTFTFLRDPFRGLKLMKPLLKEASARPALIEVIGQLEQKEGLEYLEPLIARSDLTQDEWIRLACALGEIGGEEGKVLLEQIKVLPVAQDEPVKNEIEIAWVNCQKA